MDKMRGQNELWGLVLGPGDGGGAPIRVHALVTAAMSPFIHAKIMRWTNANVGGVEVRAWRRQVSFFVAVEELSELRRAVTKVTESDGDRGESRSRRSHCQGWMLRCQGSRGVYIPWVRGDGGGAPLPSLCGHGGTRGLAGSVTLGCPWRAKP